MSKPSDEESTNEEFHSSVQQEANSSMQKKRKQPYKRTPGMSSGRKRCLWVLDLGSKTSGGVSKRQSLNLKWVGLCRQHLSCNSKNSLLKHNLHGSSPSSLLRSICSNNRYTNSPQSWQKHPSPSHPQHQRRDTWQQPETRILPRNWESLRCKSILWCLISSKKWRFIAFKTLLCFE